jgi:hypothetical protein
LRCAVPFVADMSQKNARCRNIFHSVLVSSIATAAEAGSHRYLSKPRWGTQQYLGGKSLCILWGSCAERNVCYSQTWISKFC